MKLKLFRHKRKQADAQSYKKSFWWVSAIKKWKEDNKGPIDETDPEFDVQKIYKHWLDSFK